MVQIQGGCFEMGSPGTEKERYDDEDRHEVCLKDFSIGKYEITFDQYNDFARATNRELPDDRGWGRGDRPVINVSWVDAAAYAEWLSRRTGRRYRLPTEAEWEYAARAGTDTPFWTGDCIDTNNANYDGYSDYAGCGAQTGMDRGKTVPVGNLPPNPWGLHEVLGNVWEWTCSSYQKHFDGTETRCAAEARGFFDRRVRRGGSWSNAPTQLRVSHRLRNAPTHSTHDLGFRLARD